MSPFNFCFPRSAYRSSQSSRSSDSQNDESAEPSSIELPATSRARLAIEAAAAAVPPTRGVRAWRVTDAKRRVGLETRAASLELALAQEIQRQCLGRQLDAPACQEINALACEAIQAHHAAALARGTDVNAQVRHLQRCIDVFDATSDITKSIGPLTPKAGLMARIAEEARDAYFLLSTGRPLEFGQVLNIDDGDILSLVRAYEMERRAVAFGSDTEAMGPVGGINWRLIDDGQLTATEAAKLRDGILPWPGAKKLSCVMAAEIGERGQAVECALSQLRGHGKVDLVALAGVLAPDPDYFWKPQTTKLIQGLQEIMAMHADPHRRLLARSALSLALRPIAGDPVGGTPEQLFDLMSKALCVAIQKHTVSAQDFRYAREALRYMEKRLFPNGPACLENRTKRELAQLLLQPEARSWVRQVAAQLRIDMGELQALAAPARHAVGVESLVREHLPPPGLPPLVSKLTGYAAGEPELVEENIAHQEQLAILHSRIESFIADCGKSNTTRPKSPLWLRCGELVIDIHQHAGDSTAPLLKRLKAGLAAELRFATPGVAEALGLYFLHSGLGSPDVRLVLVTTARYLLQSAGSVLATDARRREDFETGWKVMLERIAALNFQRKDELLKSLSHELVILATEHPDKFAWAQEAHRHVPYEVRYEDSLVLSNRSHVLVADDPKALSTVFKNSYASVERTLQWRIDKLEPLWTSRKTPSPSDRSLLAVACQNLRHELATKAHDGGVVQIAQIEEALGRRGMGAQDGPTHLTTAIALNFPHLFRGPKLLEAGRHVLKESLQVSVVDLQSRAHRYLADAFTNLLAQIECDPFADKAYFFPVLLHELKLVLQDEPGRAAWVEQVWQHFPADFRKKPGNSLHDRP